MPAGNLPEFSGPYATTDWGWVQRERRPPPKSEKPAELG